MKRKALLLLIPFAVAGLAGCQSADPGNPTDQCDQAEITLNKTEVTLKVGESVVLEATAPAACNNLGWGVNEAGESVVSLNKDGTTCTVTATSVGTAIVGYGTTASCTITVSDEEVVPVTSVYVQENLSQTLNAGSTLQLHVSVKPDNATNKGINYRSENEAVATVNSSGLISAIAEGTANIIVSAAENAEIKKTVAVTVIGQGQDIPVTGVKVVSPSLYSTVITGSETQIVANVLPEGATNKGLTYSTSAASVATVSTTGLIKAVASGKAVITVAAAEDSSIKQEINLTVNDPAAETPEETTTGLKLLKSGDLVADENVVFSSIIGEKYYSMPEYSSGNNIKAVESSIDSSGKLVLNASAASYKVVKNADNTFSFVDSQGRYLSAAGGESSGNYLKAIKDNDESTKFNVSISEGIASIVCIKAIAGNTLALNSGEANPMFSCYKPATAANYAKINVYHREGSGDVEVTAVEFEEDSYSVKPGKTVQTNANVIPSDATVKTITYSLEDVTNECATIDATTGLITASAEGTATVVATAKNGVKGTASLTVADVREALPYTGLVDNGELPAGWELSGSGATFATKYFALKDNNAAITASKLFDEQAAVKVGVKGVCNGTTKDSTVTVYALNDEGTVVDSETYTPKKADASSAAKIESESTVCEVSLSGEGITGVKVELTTKGHNYVLMSVAVSEDVPPVPPVLQRIEVATSDHRSFYLNDPFVPETIMAVYDKGDDVDVTEDAVFEDYDMSTAGDQTVKVTYEGKETTYDITVSEAPAPKIQSISIDADEMETEYTDGDDIDLTGVKVLANYESGSPVELDPSKYSLTCSPEKADIESKKTTLTATLLDTEAGVEPATLDVNLTVNEKEVLEPITLSTTGGTSASTAKINEIAAIKCGTGSVAGAMIMTLPKGTSKLVFHAVAWNGENVTIKASNNGTEIDSFDLVADSGFSGGGSSFTLVETDMSKFTFTINFEVPLEAEMAVKFEATAGKRFGIWDAGVKIFQKAIEKIEITDFPEEVEQNAEIPLEDVKLKVTYKDTTFDEEVVPESLDYDSSELGPTTLAANYKGFKSESVDITIIEATEKAVELTSLSFPDENSANNKVGAYDKTWTAIDENENEYKIVNFNNNNWNSWTVIKAGSKNGDSTGTITTDVIADEVTEIKINISAITTDYVTSIKLYSSASGDFTDAVEEGSFSKASGEQSVKLGTPKTGCAYMIEFVCTKSSSNGSVSVAGLTIMGFVLDK